MQTLQKWNIRRLFLGLKSRFKLQDLKRLYISSWVQLLIRSSRSQGFCPFCDWNIAPFIKRVLNASSQLQDQPLSAHMCPPVFSFLFFPPAFPPPLLSFRHPIQVFYHNSDPQKRILTRYQNKNLYLIWEQLQSEVGCAGPLSPERVFFIKQVIRP